MTTADIHKVRVRDPKGRIVREGYYFEYPKFMGPGTYDGEPPPISTVRGIAYYDPDDWNMPNTPRFVEVTPPLTIEAAEDSAVAAPPATKAVNTAKVREELLELLHYINSLADNNITSCLRAHIAAALATPPRNCDVGTPEEQRNRFLDFCQDNGGISESGIYRCHNCPLYRDQACGLTWANAPYKKRCAK